MLREQFLLQRPGVDTDPHGSAAGFCCSDNLADLIAAEIPRIHPDGVGTVLHGRDGQAVIEMDIRNERQPDSLPDRPDGGSRILIEDGYTDNLAAAFLEPGNLFDGCRDVAGVGGCHGLDRHGGIAAHGHVSHPDLARFFPCYCRRFAHECIGLNRILATIHIMKFKKKAGPCMPCP